ncbi:MAG: carbon-nitrogen hydrolase family protein [Parvibaculales bacterium]
MGKFQIGCIQLCSSIEPADNLALMLELIAGGAAAGDELIMTPENCMAMLRHEKQDAGNFPLYNEDENLTRLQKSARGHGIWLIIGSLAQRDENNRLVNRSYLIRPDGAIQAHYDKIHLFDVALPSGEEYRESNIFHAGKEAVIAELPWGKIGMSICYDIRFPHLYQELARAGAAFLSVPAAFTQITGPAHWHSLLRARAIETGCFLFAPAQSGTHENGRRTYGHSLIINPWGKVLAEAGGKAPVIIRAEIDPAEVAMARSHIPSLASANAFSIRKQGGAT